MLTMGKPMGNGHPISAVATRMEIIAKFVAKYGHELLPEVSSVVNCYRSIPLGRGDVFLCPLQSTLNYIPLCTVHE